MLAKAEDYETSCLRLEKLKAELVQEQSIHQDVNKELNTKERNVDTIRKDIEWQDKEINRLFKLLKQSDSQN